jgi:hypothetical protein
MQLLNPKSPPAYQLSDLMPPAKTNYPTIIEVAIYPASQNGLKFETKSLGIDLSFEQIIV